MRTTVLRCDRCNSETNDDDAMRLTINDGELDKDLCAKCAKSIMSWLSRDNFTKAGDTVGKYWNCLHHVPCAGPPCNHGYWSDV